VDADATSGWGETWRWFVLGALAMVFRRRSIVLQRTMSLDIGWAGGARGDYDRVRHSCRSEIFGSLLLRLILGGSLGECLCLSPVV